MKLGLYNVTAEWVSPEKGVTGQVIIDVPSKHFAFLLVDMLRSRSESEQGYNFAYEIAKIHLVDYVIGKFRKTPFMQRGKVIVDGT